MSDPTATPYDQLTPEQKERLKKLAAEVRLDKITVSFSIDDRDAKGRRKSAFYSVTGSRGHGAEVPQMHENAPSATFTVEEAKIVRCMLAKHVVGAVYDDASKRGIISRDEAREEAGRILGSYDAQIAKIVTGKNGT